MSFKQKLVKSIYQFCFLYGEMKDDNISVYPIEGDDSSSDGFQVDMGERGSCRVFEHSGQEEFELSSNEWIWVEGKWWSYICLSELYDGYPKLLKEDVIKTLKIY